MKKLYRFKRLILMTLLCSFVLSITSIIYSSAQYIYRVDPNYGFTITYGQVTLSNGTQAWRWISGDYNCTQQQQIQNSFMSSYDIEQLYKGDATYKYNCHSYAWYDQGFNNIYWINDPSNFRSGRWIKSTGWTDVIPSGIRSNDIVDYYISSTNRPHSARVYSLMLNTYVSKWGAAGLYVHRPTEVHNAYISNDLGYYR